MIVRPLMEAYDAFLREKGAVDFADMINLAAENVTAGQKSIHIGMSSLMNIKTSPMLGTDWSRQFWIRQGQIFFAWEMTGSLSTGLRGSDISLFIDLNAISDAA